jgi:deazaflavin-dependent oxidoreductase (nitroreductase family)
MPTTAAVRKQRFVTLVQRFLANPINRRLARLLPGQALVETTGRKTGLPRVIPVGGRLDGDSFWIVSEYGRRAGWVRNLETTPRVRVQLRGRWREGTAHLLDDDDPRARLQRLPSYNSFMVRLVGTNLLTIRIDLD